jgi:hypothetical protein
MDNQGTFEIVYCKLSDGSPCANWRWRGKTPHAVAVLERRGARTDRFKTARYAGQFTVHHRKLFVVTGQYREWGCMLRQMQAEIAALLNEVN